MLVWLDQVPGACRLRGPFLDGVVPRGLLTAVGEANDALVLAQAHAGALLAQAEREAETLKAAAHDEARGISMRAQHAYEQQRRRGYVDGRSEALTRWREIVLPQFAQVAEVQTRLRERFAEVIVKTVQQIVSQTDREQVWAQALEAVESMIEDNTQISVMVHPEDRAAAEIIFERLSGRWRKQGHRVHVKVTDNGARSAGSIRCDTLLGVVEIDIDRFCGALRVVLGELTPPSAPTLPDENTSPSADADGITADARDQLNDAL